jgi:hypothetical protein
VRNPSSSYRYFFRSVPHLTFTVYRGSNQ